MGESCLHLGVLAGDKSLVQLLLEHGASRYIVTSLGHLPIDYARSDIALLLRDYGTKAAGLLGLLLVLLLVVLWWLVG